MNTYKLITVNNKPCIIYKIDGVEWTREFYTGIVRPGYINEDRVKWLEMKKDLLNSGGILTTMRTASGMGGWFTILFAVIDLGIMGEPDEPGLDSVLSLPGWGFSAGQKTTINTYLTNNNFSISVT